MSKTFMIDYNYMLPIFIAFILGLYLIISLLPKKESTKNVNVPIDNLTKPFNNNISNELYKFSFKPPFVWLMPENPNSKPARKMDQMIVQARLSEYMNYRVLQTGQTLLLICAVLFTVVFGFLIQNSSLLIKILFNFEIDAESQNVVFLTCGMIFMAMALVPKMYVQSRANSSKQGFITNLPILQMFIITMLKSKRSIGEAYNVLANSEMEYNDLFRVANNIYIRDREAASEYLESAFYETPFYETILTLKTYDQYGLNESLETLEGRLETIQSEVNDMKKSKSVIKGLITEGSMMLPFAAVMLLVFFPIGYWAITTYQSALSMSM